jgi:hypothetical protein
MLAYIEYQHSDQYPPLFMEVPTPILWDTRQCETSVPMYKHKMKFKMKS